MKVLLSAQDPGGANAVIPVAVELQKRGDAVAAMAEGAARDMCAARGIALSDMSDPDIVLLGTSGGESVEKRVLLQMRGKAPTVAVLDFWSNYWQRFSGPGTKDFKYLPDMVCVMDDIARDEMLAEGFPPERIAVTGNPHFDHFADGITRESEDQKRVLFISQPIRADTKIPGLARPPSDEYDALDALCAALPAGHMLSIRLHPRDTRNKYDRYLNSRVTIAAEPTLEEALSHSGLVVGGATPVLMQAAAAGKKALCYEPVIIGNDQMVSNRAGVTVRIDSPQALKAALHGYAAGEWPYQTRPLREVWPQGATLRVVAELDRLI